jgi:EAL domain-containing protein (putative c-di-GMP-specific phosphodiesterase class I)
VQGYYFCMPLPPAELEAWLAVHATRERSIVAR